VPTDNIGGAPHRACADSSDSTFSNCLISSPYPAQLLRICSVCAARLRYQVLPPDPNGPTQRRFAAVTAYAGLTEARSSGVDQNDGWGSTSEVDSTILLTCF